ncbi:hypothetical protein L2D00_10455 [Hyphomonadaceae bacterium BL14]|nr:hypothetical protein L2D00_10455 [Hyphomonadaceae bacterium BL14]
MLRLITAALLTLQPGAAEAEPLSAPPGAALFAAMGSAKAETVRGCGVDEDELSRLIGLAPQAFDQDMQGGWRLVARQPGCEPAAAALIEAYLHFAPRLEENAFSILRWHAGQMHVSGGDAETAIAWFHAAKKPGDGPWNAYANATIAFLQGDRDAAEAARAQLATFVPSEEEQEARRRAMAAHPGIRFREGFVTQPMNLDVVDGLLACWGQPYAQAYGGCDAEAGD